MESRSSVDPVGSKEFKCWQFEALMAVAPLSQAITQRGCSGLVETDADDFRKTLGHGFETGGKRISARSNLQFGGSLKLVPGVVVTGAAVGETMPR